MENQSTADHWFFLEPFPNFAFVTKWRNLIGPLKLTAYKPKWYAWKFSERFIYRVIVTNDSDYNIAILTSTSIFLLWLGEINRMRVSILRPLHEIVMSYLLDIQKMLEILHTQTDWLTRWKIYVDFASPSKKWSPYH